MSTLTIRKIEDSLKSKIRMRAASHGHSMEEEVREILKLAVAGDEPLGGLNLAESIRRRIQPLGGVELITASREPVPRPPSFIK